MLARGFRDFIIEQMTARPITGRIQRRVDGFGEQVIVFQATGTPTVLRDMETNVLDAHNRDFWSWRTIAVERRAEFPDQRGFIIIMSGSGAVCGRGSDEHYDHVSTSSHSSRGSKRG